MSVTYPKSVMNFVHIDRLSLDSLIQKIGCGIHRILLKGQEGDGQEVGSVFHSSKPAVCVTSDQQQSHAC